MQDLGHSLGLRKYATSPRPPDKTARAPASQFGRALAPRRLGRQRLLAVAVGLAFLYVLRGRLSPAMPSLASPSRRSRARTVPVVTLPLHRAIEADPPPIHASDDNTFYTVAGVVTSQRSAWQEGGRTPYFLDYILFFDTTPVDNVEMEVMLQVKATFLSHPSVPPVACRPYSIWSNRWPLVESWHSGQPPHRLECDIPEVIAGNSTGPPRSLEVRLDWRMLQADDEPTKELLRGAHQIEGPKFAWPAQLAPRIREVSQMHHFGAVDVPHTTFTLCLVPFRNYDRYAADRTPHRWIEWRLYWQRLGVERVAWYAYEGEPRYVAFVESLIAVLGNKDQIFIVKRMVHPFPYWDQPLYYNHCGHLFRTASDYLVILDLDEVLALDPSTYDDAPASLLRFVESWDPDVGGVNLIRVDLSMQEQTFDDIVDAGGPSVELLAQDTWTALNPDPDLRKNCACRHLRKSLYRALAVSQHWVHHATWMYPRPVATDEPLPVRRESWPKPAHDWNEAWRQIAWPTVNETDPSYWEIWPRMLHYRWWGGYADGEIGTELMPSHPALVRFQDDLRKDVLRVGAIVRKQLGLADPEPWPPERGP